MTTQQTNDSRLRTDHPYVVRLNQTVADLMRLDVAGIQPEQMAIASINPDNDWIYRTLAGQALVLAYAWDCPRAAAYHQKAVWLQMERFLLRVLDNCKNGKWWREQAGTGDKNINRFTLLPLTDLFLRVGNRFSPELKTKFMDVLDKAVAVQLADYHGCKTRPHREYPNMDAYFMLIMEEAGRILNRADYHAIALDYLGSLEACLLPGGGFVYYKDTNECEGYHQVAIMTLLRFWELTQSDRILRLLERTLPYYPNAVEPSGVAECYSDPFWKHMWSGVDACSLDVMATLFPHAPESQTHRYLANRVRENSGAIAMTYLWALDYWEPGEGLKPRDPHVRYDASIRGPRGRFGSFSWGGSTGACTDTFVGAMIAEKRDRLSAFQAAGTEIVLARPFVADPEGPRKGRRFNESAYVTGHDYLRRTIVAEPYACLGASASLFQGEVAWQDFFPDSGWRTHQVWMFGPERLVGMLVIEAAHADEEPAKAVQFYLRFGGSGREVVEKDGLFVRDQLKMRVVRHTMDTCRVEPAYAFFLDANHTSTEVLLSATPSDPARTSFRALVEIFPAWHEPATITELSGAPCAGFVLFDNGMQTLAALNDGGSAVEVAELKREWGNRYRANSRQACQCPLQQDSGALIRPGELILATDSR